MNFPSGLNAGVMSLQSPDVRRVSFDAAGSYVKRCAYPFSSMDRIITSPCAPLARDDAGVDVSTVGDGAGESVVCFAQPINVSGRMIRSKIKLIYVIARR